MRWKQLKLVEKNKKAGKVKFLSAGYVPADENKMLSIGSENINDLIKTVIHNKTQLATAINFFSVERSTTT